MWIMIHTPKAIFLNKPMMEFLNQMNFSGILNTMEPDIRHCLGFYLWFIYPHHLSPDHPNSFSFDV